jgi:4-amino-4-deoxy-L-arabinose transferase-like glycosyltransferase
MSPFPSLRRALILFGVAFVLRILFLLETRTQAFHYLTHYTVDAWYFWTIAQALVHNGFSHPEAFFMPPLYPYFLAACSLVFGSHPVWLKLIQLVFGSAAAVLVYLLGARLFDRRVARVAFVAYLLCGNMLFLDTVFLPNALIVFGELLVLYLLLPPYGSGWGPSPQPPVPGPKYGIAGLLSGLLALLRAELLLMLPLLLLVAFFSRRALSFKNLGWLLLGAAVAVAPVTLHNLIVGRDFVLVSYNGGLNFYLGNNPKADGTWQPTYPLVRTGSVTIETLKRNSLVREGASSLGQLMKPSQSSSYWTARALDFIKSNPGDFFRLAARKLGLFANNYEIPNNYYYDLVRQRSLLLKLAFLPFGLILALGVAGMIAGLRTWPRSYGFYLFILVYLIAGVVIFTVSRLRAPAVPLLLVFGAYFTVELYSRCRQCPSPFALLPSPFSVLSVVALLVFAASFLPLVNRKAYDLEGLIQAGNIYLDVNQPARAKAEYLQAARRAPDNLLAVHGLFNAATRLKSRLDAEKYAGELYRLSRTPQDSVYAFLATAKLGTMTGDFPQARDYYQKALDRDPQNTDTRFLLVSVYYTLRDFASARQQLDTLLGLNPEDQEALRLLGVVQRSGSLP